MMKKIYIIVSLMFVVVILIISCWLIWHKPTGKNMALNIAYNGTNINSGPISIAYEKHFFEKNGLLPKMISITSGKEVGQALVSGQVDVVATGYTNLLAPISKGAPIRIIAPCAMAPNYIYVMPDSGIKKLTDLYGKTLSSGQTSELALRLAFSEKKLDSTRVKFIDIDKAYIPTALQKKTIDAAVVSEQDTEQLIRMGAVVLPEWQSSGYTKRALPRDTIFSTTDFLNKNPKAGKAFIKSYIEANQYIHNHPEESAQLLSDHIKRNSAGAIEHSSQYILDKWKKEEIKYFLWQDTDSVIKMAKIAYKVGMVDKELTLNELYDFRYKHELEVAQNDLFN